MILKKEMQASTLPTDVLMPENGAESHSVPPVNGECHVKMAISYPIYWLLFSSSSVAREETHAPFQKVHC